MQMKKWVVYFLKINLIVGYLLWLGPAMLDSLDWIMGDC